MMNRFVMHKLAGKESKGERRSVPVDGRIDIDSLENREESPLFLLEGWEERLTSERPLILIVFSTPVDFLRDERVIVHTAHTDDVSELFAKRREPLANPVWCRRAPRPSRRIGRVLPFVVGDGAHEVRRQCMEHFAVARELFG